MDETTFELRKLKSDDLFLLTKLLKKLGLKEIKEQLDPIKLGKLATLMQSENKNVNKENLIQQIGISVMMDIGQVVICNLDQCKSEINNILSSVSGMTEEEIEDLDFVPYCEMIVAFCKKEEFPDFIKVVSKLFN